VILITSHFAGKEDSDEVLVRNLEKFFSQTGNIPMGTYECPSPYKRIITPEVFTYLLSTNRLVYHKDTSLDPDKIKVKLEMCKGTNLEFYDAHTPNTMFSLQSCIAGNFYPEMFSWMCNHVNDPGRQEQVKWVQPELTRADAIISQGYPLSAKYFLKKRGVPVELISRSAKSPLSKEQQQALDDVHTTLMGWHERLGIKVTY
jgi:4-hydroxy-tetrahydrodipicolinate synthase